MIWNCPGPGQISIRTSNFELEIKLESEAVGVWSGREAAQSLKEK
jgi:hypothetical protein